MASLEDLLQSHVLEFEVNQILKQLYILRECVGDIEEIVRYRSEGLAKEVSDRIAQTYDKLGIKYGK